jgi:hypothetical protein
MSADQIVAGVIGALIVGAIILDALLPDGPRRTTRVAPDAPQHMTYAAPAPAREEDPDPWGLDLDPVHIPVTEIVDPLFLREGPYVYEVATGEVVEEVTELQRPRRQIGAGR